MTKTNKKWHTLDLIRVSENVLKEKNIANARLNAELLLAETLKTQRIKLYLDFDKPLDDEEISAFKERLKRRLNHEPLQYILGYAEFYGLKFNVNPNVLIPRPETELLVEKSLELLAGLELINLRILEIGTGCGCISIAIASKTNCTIDAADINEKALETAKENSTLNNTASKINFIRSNIFKDFTNFEGYNLIVSNPPYIPVDEFNNLQEEIKDFEPKYALTDGKDGLEFYRKTIELIKNTKTKALVLLEIGDGKREKIENLLHSNNISKYTFYQDYISIDRAVKIEVN